MEAEEGNLPVGRQCRAVTVLENSDPAIESFGRGAKEGAGGGPGVRFNFLSAEGAFRHGPASAGPADSSLLRLPPPLPRGKLYFFFHAENGGTIPRSTPRRLGGGPGPRAGQGGAQRGAEDGRTRRERTFSMGLAACARRIALADGRGAAGNRTAKGTQRHGNSDLTDTSRRMRAREWVTNEEREGGG